MIPGVPRVIKVFLVEDHELIRIALRAILEPSARVELIGEAGTVEAARASIPSAAPDVVIMDLRLPDGPGIELCREIRQICPHTHVLFLSSYADDESIIAAVMAGASGYLLKDIASDQLLQSIELVAGGQLIVNERIVRQLQRWRENHHAPSSAENAFGLTTQQIKMLALIAQGKTNKEIGQALGLSDKTVRNYLVQVFDKLHLSRRTQAATLYAKHLSKQDSQESDHDPAATLSGNLNKSLEPG